MARWYRFCSRVVRDAGLGQRGVGAAWPHPPVALVDPAVALVDLAVLRGGFGMPMFGGPGGGFSLSSMYSFLLNSPTVQKDLELVDDQKAKLKELNEKSRAAMRKVFSGMRDLSEDERREKMAEIGKKMQAQMEESKKAIEEILLPHQLERIKGIALQRVGTMALSDKQIQQDLKLSEEQGCQDQVDRRRHHEEDGRTVRPRRQSAG